MSRLGRLDVEMILDRCLIGSTGSLDEIEHEAILQLVRDRERVLRDLAELAGELRGEQAFGTVDVGFVVTRLDALFKDAGGRDT